MTAKAELMNFSALIILFIEMTQSSWKACGNFEQRFIHIDVLARHESHISAGGVLGGEPHQIRRKIAVTREAELELSVRVKVFPGRRRCCPAEILRCFWRDGAITLQR